MKTLKNTYFAIFDSHSSYACIVSCTHVLAENINTVSWLIILQKKVLRIMNFRDKLLHSSPFLSTNNILKFGGKITLENILFVNKFVIRQVFSTFYDWFTFSVSLHRYESDHLNIPTFWTKTYGRFSIKASTKRSWNSTKQIYHSKTTLQKI